MLKSAKELEEIMDQILKRKKHPRELPISGEYNRPHKYRFGDLKVGESYICADNYSREMMTKVSNAARIWSKKSGKNMKFRFNKTFDKKIKVTRTK